MIKDYAFGAREIVQHIEREHALDLKHDNHHIIDELKQVVSLTDKVCKVDTSLDSWSDEDFEISKFLLMSSAENSIKRYRYLNRPPWWDLISWFRKLNQRLFI